MAWANGYVHTLADNGSGNQTCLSPAIRYCSISRELRSTLQSKLDDKIVAYDTPSAQWALQMTHTSRIAPFPEVRLVVTDSFYTHHNLASQEKNITENEVLTLGTVCINTINGSNFPAVKKDVSVFTNFRRKAWLLCRAFHTPVGNWCDEGGKLVIVANYQMIAPFVAERCGYVVWKDKNTVVFYTSGLVDTPKQLIYQPDGNSIHSIHGITRFLDGSARRLCIRLLLRLRAL